MLTKIGHIPLSPLRGYNVRLHEYWHIDQKISERTENDAENCRGEGLHF